MNIEQLAQDSDSSDEDYVPEGNKEALSEVESDGDSEDPLTNCDENSKSCGLKRTRKGKSGKKKIKIEENKCEQQTVKEPCNEEDKKKKTDDLWADFMKDTGFQLKSNKSTCLIQGKSQSTVKPQLQKKEKSQPAKVKVTQTFEFAGEEVKIEKEVDQNFIEARLLLNKSNKHPNNAGLRGISNVLSQLGKKQKITTLEKSKLDWDKFKQEENIEEELQTYNKGKDGYLAKQDFLQRADLRQFEIERGIRHTERAKRFNSTL